MRAVRTGAAGVAAAVTAALVAACSSPPVVDDGSGDVGAGRWSRAAALPVPRFEGAAVAAGGRIWFIGGITGDLGDQASARESDRVDVYDPASDRWMAAPP